MPSRRDLLITTAGSVALAALGGGGVQAQAPAASPPAGPQPTAPPPSPSRESTAIAGADGIVLDDSASGVSRDWYHYMLKVPWRGTFIGAVLGKQILPGPGAIRIPLLSAPEYVVLRSTGFWMNVHSRESGVTAPRLDVTYTDGTAGRLACLADSTIDPSASAPQGAVPRLQLGVAVLRFERAARPVRAATLVAEALGSGGSTTLEVCEFISPLLPAPAPEYGLRRRGLGGRSLLHQVDFRNPRWSDPWFTNVATKPTPDKFNMVEIDGDTGAPLGRRAMCVELHPDGSFRPRAGLPTAPTFIFPTHLGRELDEVYFQYRLRFGEGWRGGTRQSGKLPGIASDTTVAGNGGGASTGKNGWSFRGLFVGEPLAADSPYNSMNGIVPIGWYSYNPDQLAQQQLYGLHLPWTGRGTLGLLEVGKDYWIDQYVKVNTPGKSNGIVRGWINGQLAYERTDHIMRAEPPYAVPGNLGINKVWMTFLHGGDIIPLPVKTLRTYWSDWTIATEYIGPP